MKRSLTVILNYNGKEILARCLGSLQPELGPRDDVLVVDNGSSDGSVPMLKRRFAWAKLSALPENTGFTGGNNAAIRFINDYQYVVLLNNDIEVEPGFLKELLSMFKLPNVGIANAVILDADGKTVDHAGGKWLSFLSGTNIGLYRGADPSEVPDQPFTTTYASGAAMAIPTNLIRQHGLFPDFFAYYEDVDLSWRIRRAGYEIYVAPNSRVLHLGSATSSQRKTLFEWYAARNRIYLFRRNLLWWQKPLILPILVILRVVLALPTLIHPTIFRARMGGMLTGLLTRVPA